MLKILALPELIFSKVTPGQRTYRDWQNASTLDKFRNILQKKTMVDELVNELKQPCSLAEPLMVANAI